MRGIRELLLFCAILLPLGLFGTSEAFAQLSDPQKPLGDTVKTTRRALDTSLAETPTKKGEYFRRAQAQRTGYTTFVTNEGIRYYGSPTTPALLMEEIGGAFPLIQSDESYGRESIQITSRTGEGFISTLINGILPANSLLTGGMLANGYPLEDFTDMTFSSGASGLSQIGSDYSASDMMNLDVERFRAPVPFSRIHYTQNLVRSLSVFDGLFSLNSSRETNIAGGLYHRAGGSPIDPFNPFVFDTRTDNWSVHGQMTYSKFLGALPHDSMTKQQTIDSILALPSSRENSLDLLVWGRYTTAFSGLSGGIAARDSMDIFDEQLAQVHDYNTTDHRIRADGLVQASLPLLAHARTELGFFATYESRRILNRDASFATYVPDVTDANRFGASLTQPLGLTVGNFETRAIFKGDIQRIDKNPTYLFLKPLSDTRLSAMFSDLLSFQSSFKISAFGYGRIVQSTLNMSGLPASALVMPSLGLSGSIGATEAFAFTASYNYAKDRATLSPSPDQVYELNNISGFVDMHFALGRHDSIFLHTGVLDRTEPKGIAYTFTTDTIHPTPRFSNDKYHSQSAFINLDAYFSHFHFVGQMSYFPAATDTGYTQFPALASDINQKFFGQVGLYFENELQEGNLRLSFGARVRYLNRVSPSMTYDPAADYYVYRGLPQHGTDSVNVALTNDPRIQSLRGMIDIIASAEIDRRAQLNISFLNILSTPYYNVSIYPRAGFQFRLDATWAFLD